MQTYDLKCSVCGRQLNFREDQDEDGDIVIYVDPCPVCNQQLEARDEKITHVQRKKEGVEV